MADRAGLSIIGMLLGATTMFVVAVGGFVVRGTLQAGPELTGNSYGLQTVGLLTAPRVRRLVSE